MREVAGEYNTAKIFTDVVDDASIAQVKELCDQEFCTGSRIRLMPDIHAGAGCTVGTTMIRLCQTLSGLTLAAEWKPLKSKNPILIWNGLTMLFERIYRQGLK